MPTAPLSRVESPRLQFAAASEVPRHSGWLAKVASTSSSTPSGASLATSRGNPTRVAPVAEVSPPESIEAAAPAVTASPASAPLRLPPVTVRATKIVDALGHELAVQLLPARDTLPRNGHDLRGGRPTPRAIGRGEWVEGLCRMLMSIGLRSVAGGQPVFIEVPEEVLMSPLVELLDPRWAVVQLPFQLPATPLVHERLHDLRSRGLVLSMSLNASSATRLNALATHVQWLHLDMGHHERSALQSLWPDLIGRQVHVRGIDRLDDFREYRSVGVHAYSGPLLSAPVVWSVDQLPACDADLLQRLRERLAHDASDTELAELVESDPALVLRLLILDCDGVCGSVSRPESIMDLIARMRRPDLPIWLELLQVDACERQADRRPAWSETAGHLSLFLRMLIERLAPERRDLQGQAALLGLIAHFRHTLPSRMVGPMATPLMCPSIEDAWLHRQCLLGAVLDIGVRLMFNDQRAVPANGIVELFDEAGRMVRGRQQLHVGDALGVSGRSG